MNPLIEKEKEKENKIPVQKQDEEFEKLTQSMVEIPKEFLPPEIEPMTGIPNNDEVYFINVPSEVINKNPEIEKIVNSGKKIKDLNDEELKLIYHYIEGYIGQRIYSASIINDIEIRGRGFEDQIHVESDSLFIGTQIHLAMETQGNNLKNLIAYEESIGLPPGKPDLSKLTPDLIKILDELVSNPKIGFVRAYTIVKNNKTVSDVKPEELKKWEEDEEYEPSKELNRLINAATKEYEKIKPFYKTYKEYHERLKNYKNKKERLRKKPENIILDELEFRKINPLTMKKTIKLAYEALTSNTVLMNVYKNGYSEIVKENKIKKYTEKVILWDYVLEDGTKIYCKSMLDRLILDFTNKTAFIEDIKTHSKPARKFVSTNYFEYGYFRSMAFYEDSVRYYLKKLGQNPDEWNFISILLPVSTMSFETGCYNPIVVISNIDLNMGKTGGYIRPIGTKFNKIGQVQWGLDKKQFDKLHDLGLIHNNAYEYYIRGWKQIVSEYEQKITLKDEKI